jgi:anti-sigma regulatory factor (Ser/Thr protein kinase)
MSSRSFVAYPMSVPAARGYVAESLVEVPPSLRETAELLVSELATNAVRHSGGHSFEVALQYSAGEHLLWVGVTDPGLGEPVVQTPDVATENGRGLQLVGLLAERWGARRDRATGSKTVWFELSEPSG